MGFQTLHTKVTNSDDSRVIRIWWFVEQVCVVLVEDFLDRQVCHGNTLELSCVWFGNGIYMWLSVFLRGSILASQLAQLGNLNSGCVRKNGGENQHIARVSYEALARCPFDIFSKLMPGKSTIS